MAIAIDSTWDNLAKYIRRVCCWQWWSIRLGTGGVATEEQLSSREFTPSTEDSNWLCLSDQIKFCWSSAIKYAWLNELRAFASQ